ncbi:site-2 protease family protein [Gelidibacter gilvus]|uniref:Zinc metalloprotease n=1 Tax=Gelidibacter gilvus TaxID=59602 RepID=A0A4V1LMR8_9FLAO|nr:site-2 protease family protein [Gelidibacter gilvus]RXJ49446.1 CBS domain-containing protein [Gelidibacter gilvus]
MSANLKLGKYYGTEIQLHWTFFLLTVWIVLSEVLSGASVDRVLFNLQFVLAVMICVLLHEMGHLLAARKFGIKTTKMVLLPVGGISTVDKTTESPKEELLITLAGPLVNIIIAGILFFAIPVSDYIGYNFLEYFTLLNEFSFKNFLFFLFIVNITLAVFNLIPAFPLDGGRILRAVLDFKFSRVTATRIATTISHVIAIFLLLTGLLFNPILLFLSLFLLIGSFSENQVVHQIDLLKGYLVRDAMLKNITVFDPKETMEDVIRVILRGSETNFVVVKNKKIVGLLYHKDIIENSNKRSLLVQEVMTTNFKTMETKEELSVAYRLMQEETHPFFPVTEKNELVGAIDFDNLHEFLLMEDRLKY